MGSAMDAPYLDPSRGRQDKAGVLVRSALLLGLVEATLIEDVVLGKLPDDAKAWVAHPRSWYGLHRFTVWILRIPLFASVAFSGFLILLATATRAGNQPA